MAVICCREGEPTIDISRIVRSRAYDDRGLPRKKQERTTEILKEELTEAQRNYCKAMCPLGSCNARTQGLDTVKIPVITSVLFKHIRQELR